VDLSHPALGSPEATLQAALVDFSKELLGNKLPFTTKNFALSLADAAKASGQSCDRQEISFDAAGNFRNVGGTCPFALTVPSYTRAAKVQVTLPSIISGKIAISSRTSSRLSFGPDLESPMLNWIDAKGASLGIEKVADIEVDANRIKIIGARHFCIYIDLSK
jgi:hypothetical protein